MGRKAGKDSLEAIKSNREVIIKLALTRIPASQSLVFWYEFIVMTVCGNVISSNP